MKHRSQYSLLALTISALLNAPAMAEDALATHNGANNDIEKIEVKGFRSGLVKATDLKKDAVGAQDTILAEDIAQFPDLNLAESLQRIPGVTITREGGEGRQISLRGLGPTFTQVQLNGMEALGTSDSPMDNRGNTNTSRAFDFNIFAAELFNQIDVKKSFSADMDEGGIGGTVALRTAKPFDYDGFKGAVNVQAGDNSQTSDTSPRVAFLLSNTWGDFGALVSLAYSNRNTSEQGYNNYRWRYRTTGGSDISELDADTQQAINDNQVRFSRGNRYSQYNADQSRTGATLALQYRPSDTLQFGVDALYGQLDSDRHEYHLQSRGSQSSTNLGCAGPGYLTVNGKDNSICSRLTDLQLNERNEAVYSEWENAAIHSESRHQQATTDVSQVALNMDWQLNADLAMQAYVGHMESKFDTNSAKVYLESFGDMTIDYSQDPFYATNTYNNGYDPTDIDAFKYHEIDLGREQVDNSFDIAKVDFEYALDSFQSIEFGASYKQYENQGTGYQEQTDRLRSQWSDGSVSDVVDPDLVFINHGFDKQSWLSTQVYGTLDKFNIDRHFAFDGEDDNVTEDTLALYAQYNFFADLGDAGELRGNLGVRYYDSDITSKGYVNHEQVSVDGAYSGSLPTLNLAWSVTDNLVLRANAGKNLTRPSLSNLTVSGTVSVEDDVKISSGNPNLKPYESNNYGVAAEYYFDNQTGYIALSYFRKDIDNFIFNQTAYVPYSDTGFSTDLIAGQTTSDGMAVTGGTETQWTRPVNMDDSTFDGWEFALQRDFDFLPAPFNNFGMILNYTHAAGDAVYSVFDNDLGETVAVNKPFLGLSDHTTNITLYYETDNWGARVSMAERSGYLNSVSTERGGTADEDENGYHGTRYWDFSAHYNVSENLKVTIEGVNLSNEREEQYSSSDDRPYNTTESGRTFYVGASYQF
ncbi:TonB-dependent receptor [Shewanella avicenniae]|uniref:TonB-dependent receptor n=1 Tax=Shewanella avicenniae TaxID=2814294 RepID=A0ABX7QSZ4_9GAMM|nr:TonB-dependent receptor [Shewanella avicenniae]QSX34120.1 TonB-dependent receptor [Shewanella avicenniae]